MKKRSGAIVFQVDEEVRSSHVAPRVVEWTTPWDLEPDERDVVVGLLGPCHLDEITTAFREQAMCEAEVFDGVISVTGMAGLLSGLNSGQVSVETVMREIRLIAADVDDDGPPKDECVHVDDFLLWWAWNCLERSEVCAALTDHKNFMESMGDT